MDTWEYSSNQEFIRCHSKSFGLIIGGLCQPSNYYCNIKTHIHHRKLNVHCVMKRERFFEIHRLFCCAETDVKKEPKSYHLVRYLIDRFNERSKLYWIPGPNNVIDDSISPSQARSPFFGKGSRKKRSKSGEQFKT